MKHRKVCGDKIRFDLEKMNAIDVWLHGRSIAGVKQAYKPLAVHDFLKFDSFSSRTCLGCLNRFIVLIFIAVYQ